MFIHIQFKIFSYVVPFVVCLKLRRNIYGVVTDIRETDGRKEIEFETWFANKR